MKILFENILLRNWACSEMANH